VLEEKRERVRMNSKAPLNAEKRARRRKKSPSKQPGDYYPIGSYEHAINRGCDRAFAIPDGLAGEDAKKWRRDHRWSPNQLRHSAATFLRKEFGIEAARIILGHSSPTVTEVYAELDRSKAADIMAKVG
jgi:integrase